MLLPKLAGVALFLGGLAALTALGLFGPEPATADGWRVLRGLVRVVAMSCLLPGFVVASLFGAALFFRHPTVFLRLRWFRLKVVLLAALTPTMHFSCRGQAIRLGDAIEAGRLGQASEHWSSLTALLATALAGFLAISAIGRLKPRLGERPGSRAVAGAAASSSSSAPPRPSRSPSSSADATSSSARPGSVS
jgi:hypothetical protein